MSLYDKYYVYFYIRSNDSETGPKELWEYAQNRSKIGKERIKLKKEAE